MSIYIAEVTVNSKLGEKEKLKPNTGQKLIKSVSQHEANMISAIIL